MHVVEDELEVEHESERRKKECIKFADEFPLQMGIDLFDSLNVRVRKVFTVIYDDCAFDWRRRGHGDPSTLCTLSLHIYTPEACGTSWAHPISFGRHTITRDRWSNPIIPTWLFKRARDSSLWSTPHDLIVISHKSITLLSISMSFLTPHYQNAHSWTVVNDVWFTSIRRSRRSAILEKDAVISFVIRVNHCPKHTLSNCLSIWFISFYILELLAWSAFTPAISKVSTPWFCRYKSNSLCPPQIPLILSNKSAYGEKLIVTSAIAHRFLWIHTSVPFCLPSSYSSWRGPNSSLFRSPLINSRPKSPRSSVPKPSESALEKDRTSEGGMVRSSASVKPQLLISQHPKVIFVDGLHTHHQMTRTPLARNHGTSFIIGWTQAKPVEWERKSGCRKKLVCQLKIIVRGQSFLPSHFCMSTTTNAHFSATKRTLRSPRTSNSNL